MVIAAIVSLGASVFESNTGEAVPMLKEVAQSCYIVAIVAFCFAYIFPLVKKYGGVLIALTLDESGIPDTAEGRVDIAFKIIDEAAKYGITGE